MMHHPCFWFFAKTDLLPKHSRGLILLASSVSPTPVQLTTAYSVTGMVAREEKLELTSDHVGRARRGTGRVVVASYL